MYSICDRKPTDIRRLSGWKRAYSTRGLMKLVLPPRPAKSIEPVRRVPEFGKIGLSTVLWTKLGVTLLTVTTFVAASQGMIDLKVRALAAASLVPISSLAATDPVRKAFMSLHGMSMMFLLFQIILGILIVTVGALTSWREQLGVATVTPVPDGSANTPAVETDAPDPVVETSPSAGSDDLFH